MARIKSGNGFAEASRQAYDAANAAEAARLSGDTAAEAKANERLDNATSAAKEYVEENYGS
ncbi:hypothetical protein [Streptomyces sp. NPDC017448]|uniref:hypothetical protein n=1 Tax=Streptomyces sp. NPDC017448 TaxID=3364996 RepID=UPI0037A10425